MTMKRSCRDHELSEFEKVADAAWIAGAKAWEQAKNTDYVKINQTQILEEKMLPQQCPSSMIVEGADFVEGGVMFLPRGLVAGSSITLKNSCSRIRIYSWSPRLWSLQQHRPFKTFAFQSTVERELEPWAYHWAQKRQQTRMDTSSEMRRYTIRLRRWHG